MSYWHEPLRIANFSFPRFVGGPLDGITDSPYRRLMREFSTDELLYTEMRHVACVANDKGGTKALKFGQMERPLNYQIAANSVRFIPAACEKIMAAGVDLVDLNVGCPARNVIGSGSGSSLMAQPDKLKEILDTMREHLNIPFTVKIRAGFKEKNAVDIAKLIQGCGASAIAVHPRLQTQKFEGRPDYELVAQVKKEVSIPVLVSGNVVNWMTAKMVYEQTGVDGFLIGRGLWSRPWKLLEMREHSMGNAYTVSLEKRIECAIKHLNYTLEHYGPHGLYMFRKHLPFYLCGIPGASKLRSQLVRSECVDQVRKELEGVVAT